MTKRPIKAETLLADLRAVLKRHGVVMEIAYLQRANRWHRAGTILRPTAFSADRLSALRLRRWLRIPEATGKSVPKGAKKQ